MSDEEIKAEYQTEQMVQEVGVSNPTSELTTAASEAPMTQEQLVQQVVDFKNDPEKQQQALDLAEDMQKYLGGKWCTLKQVSDRTKLTELLAFQKLKLLELFGYCVISKRERDVVFKVVIQPEDKIKAIESRIQFHQDEIDRLKLEIKIISAAQPEAEATKSPYSSATEPT